MPMVCHYGFMALRMWCGREGVAPVGYGMSRWCIQTLDFFPSTQHSTVLTDVRLSPPSPQRRTCKPKAIINHLAHDEQHGGEREPRSKWEGMVGLEVGG